MLPEHTRRGPARYAADFQEARIRALESETVRRREQVREPSASKKEYLRDIRQPIGWDRGEEATLSFVECAGGEVARSFHGRPMSLGNVKVAAFSVRGAEP